MEPTLNHTDLELQTVRLLAFLYGDKARLRRSVGAAFEVWSRHEGREGLPVTRPTETSVLREHLGFLAFKKIRAQLAELAELTRKDVGTGEVPTAALPITSQQVEDLVGRIAEGRE